MGDREEEEPLLQVAASPAKAHVEEEGPTLRYRWTMLFFICVLTFGSYYVFDNPGALQHQLMQYFDINTSKYEWLYSIYSWPNTVQVFLGGWLIDRYLGIRWGATLFCFLVMAGQVVFAIGANLKSYPLAFAGRLIFGLGGESLSVAQSTYVAKWFKGNELAMAFGITLSTSRIGSAVNFNVEPDVARKYDVPTALWLGADSCIISMLAAYILMVMDRKGEMKQKKKVDVRASDPVSLWDVFYFPASIWFIYLICISFYVSIFTFVTISQDYFKAKFNYSPAKAGRAISVIYFISAGISPFLGFAVDKLGRSVFWVLAASSILTGCHLCFIFFSPSWLPWAVIPVMGIGYSLCAAALWPSVALLVDTDKLGTAYGLMTALQNLGLAVAPLATAALINKAGYDAAIWIFAVCSGAAVVFSIMLLLIDAKNGVILNASAADLAKRRAEKEAAVAHSDEAPVRVYASKYTKVKPTIQPRAPATVRRDYLARLGLPPGPRAAVAHSDGPHNV